MGITDSGRGGGGGSSSPGGGTGGGAEGGHGNGGNAGAASAGGGASGGGGIGGEVSSAPAPGLRDLAIVELLINPAGTDTGREWIEIVNRTTHALDLAGLNISDAANDAAVNFGTATATTLLPAGASAILIQSADPTKNGGVTIGGATPGGSFGTLVSLNNDADTISICSGPCATGVVIDSVSWDATLGTGYDGHALMIDDSGRRCPATLPFGDAGSFGSPGVANSPCP